MRYLWITIGVAILHRVLVFGIAMLGFGIGMSAFNGNPSASMGATIMGLAGILDFPFTMFGWIGSKLQNAQYLSFEHFGLLGVISLKSPFLLQAAWSLTVGASVATVVYFRRLKKYGRQPVTYWRKGL